MRLLYAEDEVDLNQVLTKELTDAGYSVDACTTGTDALEYLTLTDYDGVILDIMMPGMDGFAVITRARKKGIRTPVLFLTAKDAVEDKVRGLDLGADDYLVKPFSTKELLARIRVMTRRAHGESAGVLAAGDLVLDPAAHTVTRGGKEIVLSSKEFALLEYLLHNKNRVVTREQIEDHIWNWDYEGGTNVVEVYISYLRKKVDAGRAHRLIRTVRGSGYMLRDRESA